MKQIASRYPYESRVEGEHSLKGEAQQLGKEMVALLQQKVVCAGVHVLDFALTDLAYSEEIAGAMLVRQQAEALIDARKLIVEGAVEISCDAAERLALRGIELDMGSRNRLVSNIITVVSGDSKVQPVVNVSNE
jgi:hypothetical protein